MPITDVTVTGGDSTASPLSAAVGLLVGSKQVAKETNSATLTSAVFALIPDMSISLQVDNEIPVEVDFRVSGHTSGAVGTAQFSILATPDVGSPIVVGTIPGNGTGIPTAVASILESTSMLVRFPAIGPGHWTFTAQYAISAGANLSIQPGFGGIGVAGEGCWLKVSPVPPTA